MHVTDAFHSLYHLADIATPSISINQLARLGRIRRFIVFVKLPQTSP